MKTLTMAMLAAGALAALGCEDKKPEAKPASTPAAAATDSAKPATAPAAAPAKPAHGGW
jgi:hypothetical protein